MNHYEHLFGQHNTRCMPSPGRNRYAGDLDASTRVCAIWHATSSFTVRPARRSRGGDHRLHAHEPSSAIGRAHLAISCSPSPSWRRIGRQHDVVEVPMAQVTRAVRARGKPRQSRVRAVLVVCAAALAVALSACGSGGSSSSSSSEPRLEPPLESPQEAPLRLRPALTTVSRRHRSPPAR